MDMSCYRTGFFGTGSTWGDVEDQFSAPLQRDFTRGQRLFRSTVKSWTGGGCSFKMAILYLLLLGAALAHAQQARHRDVTYVTPVYSTVTKTIIPTCYEPAETLNFCHRKKKQLAILYDPTSMARGMLPNVQQFEAVPVQLGKSGMLARQDYDNSQEAPEVFPSLQQYPAYQAGPAGEFINLFGGYVTKTKTTVLVTATATALKTQTVLLDCIHPGSYVPNNFCDVSMIFPAPPAGVELSQYCFVLGQLAKVRVDACEEVSLSSGIMIYVRFGKGPYAPYPSRRLVMKYMIMSLLKTCNLKVGKCQLPGMPYGWLLELNNIYIPGILNVNTLITEILIEVLGVGGGCPNTDHLNFPNYYPFTRNGTEKIASASEAETIISGQKKQSAIFNPKYSALSKQQTKSG